MNSSTLSESPYRSCEVPLEIDLGRAGDSLPFVKTCQPFWVKVVKDLKEQIKVIRNKASSIVKAKQMDTLPSIDGSLHLQEVIVCETNPVPSGGCSSKSCVIPMDKTTTFMVLALIFVAMLLFIACNFIPLFVQIKN